MAEDDPLGETTIGVGVTPHVRAHPAACDASCDKEPGRHCRFPVPRCLPYNERLVLARRLDRYAVSSERDRKKPTHYTQVRRDVEPEDVLLEIAEREFEQRIGFEKGTR